MRTLFGGSLVDLKSMCPENLFDVRNLICKEVKCRWVKNAYFSYLFELECLNILC